MSSDDDRRSDSEEEDEAPARKPVAPRPPVRNEAEEARKRIEEEERRKREDKERKKAEVRKRLEETAKAKNKKTGFMTPERKKKLRLLLRKLATEQLKKEQERKAVERRKIIKERVGDPKSMDGANEATLQAICKEYHKRICSIEDLKYDLEYEVRQKDYLINELNVQVNNQKGRYVKPVLKHVSKYEKLKAAKLKKTGETNFRVNLKQVDKSKLNLDDDDSKEKPEWALGAKGEKAGGGGRGEEEEEEE